MKLSLGVVGLCGGRGRREGGCYPTCSPPTIEPRFFAILGLAVVQISPLSPFFRGGSSFIFFSLFLHRRGLTLQPFHHPSPDCVYLFPADPYILWLLFSLCASSLDVMSLFSPPPPSFFPIAPICCIVDRDGISRERLTDRACGLDDSVARVWLSGCGGCSGTSKDRDQLDGSGGVFTLVVRKATVDQSIRYLSLARTLLSRVPVWCAFKSVRSNLKLSEDHST